MSHNGNGNGAASEKLSVVSLFSGCGGMDYGFRGGFSVLGKEYAALPFQVKWANDLSASACKTYKKNLDDVILPGDIWQLLDKLPKRAGH